MSLHRLVLIGLSTAVCIQTSSLIAEDTTSTPPAQHKHPPTTFFASSSSAEQRIHASLDDETTINFADTPLTDAVQYLTRQHEIGMLIDVASLESGGITIDAPINLVLSGTSLRSALRIMLNSLNLDYIVANEVLMVTTAGQAADWYVTRVYPVGDLVSSEQGSWDELVDAVHATAGTRWATDKDPRGSVAVVRAVGSLVVTQANRGHEEIVHLLESLRNAQSLQAGRPPSANPAPPENAGR